MMWRYVPWLVVAAAVFGVIRPETARAGMREVRHVPADCRSVLPQGIVGTVQEWQAFVRLEHCDRIKRLKQLSATLPPSEQPLFFEEVVPASRLPSEFGVDIPVLRVVFPERVFFDTAEARLRAETQPITDIVARSLRNEPPDVAMFVAGHADQRGEREYNEALSIDRANAIAEAIYRKGIAFSSTWRIGFGEDMPLAEGTSSEALDRNRRIEFLFAAKPEAVGQWLADQQPDLLCAAPTRAAAERCKSSLTFNRDYEAVEVGRTTPRPARAAIQKPRERVTPSKERREAVQARSRAEPSRIGVPRNTRVRAVPVSVSAVETSPTGTRRIRIVPRNPKTQPIRVDLR